MRKLEYIRGGSYFLGLKNNKDYDFITYYENNLNQSDTYKDILAKNYNLPIDRVDILWISKKIFDQLQQKDYSCINSPWYIHLFQYDQYFQESNCTLNFHILDAREIFIKCLQEDVCYRRNDFCPSNRHNLCPKVIYKFTYLYYILLNNSPKLTEEQLAICQKIHDHQMPVSFINELGEKIYQLK